MESFLDGRVLLHSGDMREVLAGLPDNSIDSCVTDPPYHLTSIVKRFGAENAAPAKHGKDGAFARASRGFMGKQWDGGEIAFEPETWAEVLRVLKPGGHVAAFGATKNFGFMQNAMTWGGFEVRDVIAWLFGSGFPKSHNLPDGWGTALKPAFEPIVLARKPLSEGTVAANVLRWRTGALNIDACRVGTDENLNGGAYAATRTRRDDGWGMQRGGAGEYTPPSGRWPANVCHDGSDEVVGAFPLTGASSGRPRNNGEFKSVSKGRDLPHTTFGHEDAGGSAARFFYSAKADADDRIGSKHPTVKPVDLMQWLVRLITPPGGTVLDPFAGTGTTGEAAFREGFNAVLVEREAEYQADIRRRMKLAEAGPDERARESLKAAGKADYTPMPLFGSVA